MLNSSKKPQFIEDVNTSLTQALSVVAVSTRGISAVDISKVRSTLRDEKVGMRMVNNKLTLRAIADTDFAPLGEVLKGPTTLVWSEDEPGKPARMVKNLLADFDQIEVKGICLNGELLGSDRLDAIASLPTRDEALSKLAGTLQAPISKFANILLQVPTKIALALTAVKESKE